MATERWGGGRGEETKCLERMKGRRCFFPLEFTFSRRTGRFSSACAHSIVFHIVGQVAINYGTERALNYARGTINRDTAGETVDVNKASCRVESVPSDVYTPAIRRSTLIEFPSDAAQPSRTRFYGQSPWPAL